MLFLSFETPPVFHLFITSLNNQCFSFLPPSHSGTSTSTMTAGMQGWSTPPTLRSHSDDSPLLRSMSPIHPMRQPSPSKGDEVSLAAVFVPLESVKPSGLSKEIHDFCGFLHTAQVYF